MATKTAAGAGKPVPADSSDANAAQGVSSRRLKKREIDRRCQRQARERTKSRIAYLEGLVEDFRRQDASGQVATLMEQLKEVESERDLMSKALKDIQKAMDTHKPLRQSEEQSQDGSIPTFRTAPDDANIDRKPSINPLPEDAPLPPDHGDSPTRPFDLATFSPAPDHLKSQDSLFAPEIVLLDRDSPSSNSQALVQSKPVRDPHLMPSLYNNNWAVSRRSCSCCNHGPERRPGKRSVWQGNYWRYANEVLSERFDWTDEVSPASDALSEDVPIRALLEGWDAVAKRGPLHPSWRILRRIDETLFANCPNTERLAIMRAMHMLLQFHTESTSERYARLPPWYMRRPSQKIAHSYAIDYFAWPGVRERFIFSEHDYCGNEFWHLFCKSIRILWPYEFRDCYTREIETGLYKVSPMFDQRLTDIKCWTMGPDIFNRYPELYSDMPAFNYIPTALSPGQMQPQGQQRLLAASPSSTSVETVTIKEQEPEEEEDQVKPPPAGSLFYSRDEGQAQRHQVQQPEPNPHEYNLTDYNSMVALDAFAYGAMSDAEMASFYHPEVLEAYQNMIF